MTGYQSKKAAALDKLNRAIEPHTTTFHNLKSDWVMPDWVMRITADRRIEVNEGVEVTEAAQKVLDALQHLLKPAQRTWVGLTPEEILDLFDTNNVYGSKWVEFARAVEAKLREKNT